MEDIFLEEEDVFPEEEGVFPEEKDVFPEDVFHVIIILYTLSFMLFFHQ